jgi:hypothetical protein
MPLAATLGHIRPVRRSFKRAGFLQAFKNPSDCLSERRNSALSLPRAGFDGLGGISVVGQSHGNAPLQASRNYQAEHSMYGDNRNNNLLRRLQSGICKVSIARALTEDLYGLRKPAAVLSGDLDCHENTARNYLAGVTEPKASELAKLAKLQRYPTLGELLKKAFIPDCTTLDEDLEALRLLQARVEARLREELAHVHPDLSISGQLPQALIDRSFERVRHAQRTGGSSSRKG